MEAIVPDLPPPPRWLHKNQVRTWLSSIFQHHSLSIPANDTLLQWNLKPLLKSLLVNAKANLEALICGEERIQLNKLLPWIHVAPLDYVEFDPDLSAFSVLSAAHGEIQVTGIVENEVIERYEEIMTSFQSSAQPSSRETRRATMVDRFMKIRGHSSSQSSRRRNDTAVIAEQSRPVKKLRVSQDVQLDKTLNSKDLSSRLLITLPRATASLSKHIYLANSSLLTQTNLVKQLEMELNVDLIERQLDLVSGLFMILSLIQNLIRLQDGHVMQSEDIIYDELHCGM
jgi:hypothetical protein